MPKKRNAPGFKAEGVVCLLGGDTDAYSTTEVRVQYLTRCGLPPHRATAIASLCFGEVANA
jgi:hypothetical protein